MATQNSIKQRADVAEQAHHLGGLTHDREGSEAHNVTKYVITCSKYPGSTVVPMFRASATALEGREGLEAQGRRTTFPQFGGQGGIFGGTFWAKRQGS